MWNRPGRKTHSDRPGEDAAKGTPSQVSSGRSHQPQPQDQCPAGEAINSNRKTSAQRVKDQRQTSTAGRGPRTKDQGQLRRFGPSCVRRTNVKLRSGSIPSWETLGLPVQQGSRTQGFYGWKPWKKPNNASIITALGTRCEGFRRPTAQFIRFSSHFVPQKFT